MVPLPDPIADIIAALRAADGRDWSHVFTVCRAIDALRKGGAL
jgi:hypothetical protein